MTRPARVIIDLEALRHNLSRTRLYAPRSKVLAIVKADAYGHGLSRVANALADVDGFGVACLEEAQALRQAGARQKILLLEGPYCADELPAIEDLRLDMVIHHQQQINLLKNAVIAGPVHVWLKVDSGMHRLGFAPAEVDNALLQLKRIASIAPHIRLMSHLAMANEPDSPMTKEQIALFADIISQYQGETSLANSAGVIAWGAACSDWVRPGLMLYGVSPIDNKTAAECDLKPVMSLESALICVRQLKRGEPVGYGASWRCPEDMPIGIVAAGYGDGFPRHATSGTPVLVNGKRCRLIGKSSMDMITVDLREYPDAKVGDPVLIWGKDLPVAEIAGYAGTVPYELLCGVHKRLSFIERGE